MNKKKEPNIAPGVDDQEELNASATDKEVADGEYTSVTTLSYDEVDPSWMDYCLERRQFLFV